MKVATEVRMGTLFTIQNRALKDKAEREVKKQEQTLSNEYYSGYVEVNHQDVIAAKTKTDNEVWDWLRKNGCPICGNQVVRFQASASARAYCINLDFVHEFIVLPPGGKKKTEINVCHKEWNEARYGHHALSPSEALDEIKAEFVIEQERKALLAVSFQGNKA